MGLGVVVGGEICSDKVHHKPFLPGLVHILNHFAFT